MTDLPTLDRVEINREAPIAGLKPSIVVRPFYRGVDRPEGVGIDLNDTPAHWALARRLQRAINAGVASPISGIGTDCTGKTYARTTLNVMGKYLNADLKRLGF